MTEVILQIGSHNPVPHRFHDPHEWESVRSQIQAAVDTGRGLIKINQGHGHQVTYVYTPAVMISWTEIDHAADE